MAKKLSIEDKLKAMTVEELWKDFFDHLGSWARVRFDSYEFSLWAYFGVPIREIHPAAMRHMRQNGILLRENATAAEIAAKEKKLFFQERGCRKACEMRLKILSECLSQEWAFISSWTSVGSLDPEKYGPQSLQKALDWLTYDFIVSTDPCTGEAMTERGYGDFPVRVFVSDEKKAAFFSTLNRQSMKKVVQKCLAAHKMLPFSALVRVAFWERRLSHDRFILKNNTLSDKKKEEIKSEMKILKNEIQRFFQNYSYPLPESVQREH